MNDITAAELEAKKPLAAPEFLWKPKAVDFEHLSRLRVFLEEDRETKIRIDAPAAGAEFCSPVQVLVTWTRPAEAGSFRVDLDGQDITSRFSVDEPGMKATARLDLEGGSYPTLKASVVMFRWLPQPGPRRMESVASFHLLNPRWDLSLSGTPGADGFYVVDVLPGRTPIRVVATPTQCTPPDLIVKAFTSLTASQVPGIGFEIPFTIPKGSTYGFLYANVQQSVPAGLYWAFVIASTPQDDKVGTASSFLPFYLNVLPH